MNFHRRIEIAGIFFDFPNLPLARRIYSEIEVVSVAAEEKSGGVEMERIGSSDLAEQDVYSRSEECESGDEFSTSSIGCSFSRTAGELCGDPEEASIINPSKRPRQPPANHRRTIAEGMPSASELEEFFAAAEKSEQKRFANK
ncbi:hypothetical protein M569_06856 [Genlisea aurea]|uniref:Cyclin-dependent kinase inhibitor n=1 Tax=Genlisea aurea TaxID=192259 RepID=S8CLA2_9LAMI|nr:hypothetical protein M569_06856 [Genlisea aurea]